MASHLTNSSPFFLLLLLLLLLITVSVATSSNAFLPQEKMTHLHFYLHEIQPGSPNANEAIVVPPQKNSPTGFGRIGVFDDPLRMGPSPSSKLIGRSQGVNILCSMEEAAGLIPTNFVFTAGKYNGSSLTFMARLGPTIPVDVLGGSGQFRLARGYGFGNILNKTDVLLVMELDIYVSHY